MASLTVKSVDAMRPGKSRREEPDSNLPGLYFIVQPSGAKSWAVRYRHAGRTIKLTLGSYPKIDLKTARELGRTALRAVAEGRNPAAEKKPALAGGDVEAVIGQFIERYCARRHRPKTRKETERYLRKFVEKFGDRKVADITRADVRVMLDNGGDPTVADNRTFSAIRKFFGWALENDIIAASPCAGLKRPLEKEPPRDRVLKDTELRQVWVASENMAAPYTAMVKLLILTGQRRSEVMGMQWSEIDLDERLWTLPPERTKNGRRHEVPLSPQAIAIIKALPRISDQFVISLDGKRPINCSGEILERLRALAEIPHWTLHDLRRTTASGMARLGIGLTVIEKCLNHVSGSLAGIVGVYQRHEFAKEKRDAMEKWAGHVTAIVAGNNVRSLVRA
jgi:integrase